MAGHGGARVGAGRKKLDAGGHVSISIRLTRRQQAILASLGGAQWVRDQLTAAEASRVAQAIQNARAAAPTVVRHRLL